jgi:hypothetical protein
MRQIVEADDVGVIHLPSEWLGTKPHARYTVDHADGAITIRPVDEPGESVQERPLWERLTPQERIEDLRRWVQQERPPAPNLPDESLQADSAVAPPTTACPPHWEEFTPRQRADQFLKFAARQEPSDIHLTDEQLRRENICD